MEVEVKLKSSPLKHKDRKIDEGEIEREQYNAELEWIKFRPPSEEQLVGKLFMGWYQTEDITNYELSSTYKHKNQIDMKEIIDDIPRFIASCRESLRSKRVSELPDLGRLLEGLYQAEDLRSFTQDVPAFVEDCRTSVQNSGHPNITNSPRNNKNSTSTADSNAHDNRPLSHTCTNCNTLSSEPQTLYVMLDYLLEISVPEHLLHHFTTFKNKVQNTTPRSRPQSARSRATRGSAHRWVFIPCHCDVSVCYGNMFHCLDSVIPVLVVPYERYEKYTKVCENSYVIVRLPSCVDKTTGFTNYWIQLIARKLSLEQIWIVEDQVKSFYRAVPNQRLPLAKSGNIWSYDIPRISRRLVSFTEVMKHLEEKMEQDAMYNPTNPMSMIGLSNEICGQSEAYSYNIPIGAILLNIRNLGDLKFHPELHQIDTQVLACEAVKSGQRVFVCNSFVLLDASWNLSAA